jgi:hypothetical protein
LKESEVPNAKSLSALVGLIPKLLPKSGVTVEAVIRSRSGAPTKGCTITLTDLSSGRVLDTFTQWRTNDVDAADAAAICAIAHILDRDPLRRRTPNWSRFGQRSRKALEALVKGDDCLAQIDGESTARKGYEAAIKEYAAALKHDPSNLSVAMKLGGAQEILAGKKEAKESAEQMFDAVQTYLRLRALWSYAYAPRYRAAIALAACAEHAVDLKEKLNDLFERKDEARSAEDVDCKNRQACREAANDILQSLVDDLRWSTVVRRWLETFYMRREREAGTRRYFQRFVKPFSRKRIQLRATYKMAKPVVLLGEDTDGADRDVKKLLCETYRQSYRLLARLSVNWQVRYNAACYYARRARYATDDDRLLSHANQLLEEVLRDPKHEVTGAWLRRDSDLEPLRKWSGAGWRDVNVIGELDS